MAFDDYFSVQVFFLTFREVLESAIIVSILLSILNRAFESDEEERTVESAKIYNRLRAQVWAGSICGVAVCAVIGTGLILIFRILGKNLWNTGEKLWEAFFCILASVLITIMGKPLLRIDALQNKWRRKLTQHLLEHHPISVAEEEATDDLVNNGSSVRAFAKKNALFILPFVTTMREGLEAVTFLGGLGISVPASSIPLAVGSAFVSGILVGMAIYKYGTHRTHVQTVILAFTCLLYLVAAGLMSRGVWFIEMHNFISKVGNDISESGSGPGSYNIKNTVWHVNCCNPEIDGPFIILNGLVGWQNTATYGSVISYNLYWIVVIAMVGRAMYKERKQQGIKTYEENERLVGNMEPDSV